MILNSEQIKNTQICGQILKTSLYNTLKLVRVGVDCHTLDQAAEKNLLQNGAKPSFKNYLVEGIGRYPYTILTSVNNEVVHGLPLKTKILHDGDIISIDIGAGYKGVYTDMAVTVAVGNISKEAESLIEATKKALDLGISAVAAGGHIGDIGHAIQTYAESFNFGVVRDLVGHGIGTKPHMEPQIPNYGKFGAGPKISNGMALAIEPMITNGSFNIKTGDDDWTIYTADNSLAAHFEHTVVLIDDEVVVVTK